jgi:hypothetical protein
MEAKADPARTALALAGEFEAALRSIVEVSGLPEDIVPPLKISLRYLEERIESERHDYRLVVDLANDGSTVVRDWSIELRFPRALLDPRKSYPIVEEASTRDVVVMRRLEREHSGPLYPGDKRSVLFIDYMMTHELYDERARLFPMEVVATAFIGDRRVHTTKTAVRELQIF